MIFPEQIASIFTNEKEVVRVAGMYLFITGFSEPFLGAFFTMIGGLRGAGYTKVPMFINMIFLIGVRLGLCYLLAVPLGLGMNGLWIGMLIETVLRTGVIYLAYRRGRWAEVEL